MARVKVSRELALKAFVTSLSDTFGGGDNKVFTRANVEAIGKTNGLGQMLFASQSQGYGKMTRIGQGSYTIPEAWLTGSSPWEGVTEVVPVAKAEPKPKAPKKAKKEKPSEDVEVDTPMQEDVPAPTAPAKKKLSKKDLLEKAKEEIAKRKMVSVAASAD